MQKQGMLTDFEIFIVSNLESSACIPEDWLKYSLNGSGNQSDLVAKLCTVGCKIAQCLMLKDNALAFYYTTNA